MNFLALFGLTVLAGLIGAGFAGVTITVFLHRGITHGSHRMKRPVYEAGRWLTFFFVYMRHWEWRRIHRKHHKYTDVWIDEIRHDPHSPVVISQREGIDGYRRVSWHMAEIFHAEAKCPDIRDDTYDDPRLDRPFDWFDDHVFMRPVFGGVTLGLVYALIFALAAPPILGVARSVGWEFASAIGGILALGVHIATVLRFGGAINSDCHRAKVWLDGAGYAKNVKFLSVAIFGEGEHLTHHLYPQIARISNRWDLGWRIIAVLRFFGLTEVPCERKAVLGGRRLVLKEKEVVASRT